MDKRLRSATTCPICGRPMTHYRLRGYQCWDERHNELRKERQMQLVQMAMKGIELSEEREGYFMRTGSY